jgi:hypothetical protein
MDMLDMVAAGMVNNMAPLAVVVVAVVVVTLAGSILTMLM